MPSRQAPTITVLFDGQEQKYFRAIKVQRSAGGRRLDHCIIQLDMGAQGTRLQDLGLAPGQDTEITIVGSANGGDDDGDTFTYFWGKYRNTRMTLDAGVEKLEVIGQITEELFGDPIYGIWTINVAEGWGAAGLDRIDGPIVFNPQLDGRTFGNKSVAHQWSYSAAGSYVHAPLFVDPESILTASARKAQGEQTAAGGDPSPTDFLWKLSDVLNYLFFAGNSDEDTIQNPDPDDVKKVVDDTNDLVRNFHLPQGLYLPAALDRLLEPLGYSWFLHLGSDGDFGSDDDLPQIQIFKRGQGTQNTFVNLQKPGSVVSTDLGNGGSNMTSCELQFDLSAIYNQITGLGSYLEVEGTFTLAPAWNDDYDDPNDLPSVGGVAQGWEALDRSLPGWDTGKLTDVWRRWALNEAGDYNDARSDAETYDWTDDLETPLQDSYGNDFTPVPKRRKFLPTLTLKSGKRPIGKVHGTTLEYYDINGKTWVEVAEGYTVLDTECGVYFGSDKIPQFLQNLWYASGQDIDQIQLRITASVRFDTRLRQTAERQKSSAIADTRELVLDWEHLFFWRYLDRGSKYFDDFFSGNLDAYVDDDAQEMMGYLTQLRDAWDMAAINGPIVCEGIDDWREDPPYEIGQSVTQIAGRNISLNAVASGGAAYPQVIGVTYDFQKQKTTLQLERFRKDEHGVLRKAPGLQGDLGQEGG